jgi:DNA-binding XRE family transcriptional regulator
MSITEREPVPYLPEPAERVRLRRAFNATQDEIAAHVGVIRRTVYAWEHGITEPTGERRTRYAELLATWAQKETQSTGDNYG